VMCASRDSVRNLMLGVEETGMLDTSQYVFINIGKLRMRNMLHTTFHQPQHGVSFVVANLELW
jgi:hypothetical protein